MLKSVGNNSFYPLACHAFFKRKDAREYLNGLYDEEVRVTFELITVDL